MAMAKYPVSTQRAAEIAGIHRGTLQRWLRKRPECPKASVEVPLGGGLTLRRWSAEDVAKLKAYVYEHKLEGPGRPAGSKSRKSRAERL